MCGLTGFWVLVSLIFLSNALGMFYIGRLEDELDKLYKILEIRRKKK